jgi:DNA repair exonuclease SbcCD ATPase subunit
MNAALNGLDDAFDTLETERDTYRGALVSARNDLSKSTARREELEVEVQQLRSNKAALTQVVETTRAERDNLRENRDELKKEVTRLSEQLEISRAANEQLKQISTRNERTIHDLEGLRLNVVAALQNKERELGQANNDFNSVARQLAEAKDTLRVVREANEDYEQALVDFAVRHTMYSYGTVPPEGQADRIVQEVLQERETVRNMVLARGSRK